MPKSNSLYWVSMHVHTYCITTNAKILHKIYRFIDYYRLYSQIISDGVIGDRCKKLGHNTGKSVVVAKNAIV